MVARPSRGQTGEASRLLHGDRRINRLRSDAWGADDGLPSDQVFDILQTQDGYLWRGTGAGLTRFDGVKFTTFDQGNTPALAADQITQLLESRDGTLWVGTDSGTWRSPAGGTFEQVENAPERVLPLVKDHDNTLWMGGPDRRLAAGRYVDVKLRRQGCVRVAIARRSH